MFIDRRGAVKAVLVGNHRTLPVRNHVTDGAAPPRLAGIRLVHTVLEPGALSKSDLTDLSAHRFDAVAGLTADQSGEPKEVHLAHLAPAPDGTVNTVLLAPERAERFRLPFDSFVENLEDELRRTFAGTREVRRTDRAVLCAVALPSDAFLDTDIEETRELARTCGLEIVDTTVQPREKPDPKFMFGKGKLEEAVTRAAQRDADMLLFQQNLSPNQLRHLVDSTRLKIIDRTQLILDIFAQRARSHDGKLQVELAQLRYMLPRLREREAALSRLVGGIGGRGPGETKLEEHRRRAKERIGRLEKEIDKISRRRAVKRRMRARREMPIVAIVGYTNAGKSTLLNSLTNATALAENRLFATLDPFSKRLRFPRDREVVLTDTVGFIRNLPPDLIAAFRATLEEIGQADLLVHVADISTERYADQIQVVERLLEDLGFGRIPRLLALNKMDLLDPSLAAAIARSLGGTAITALDPESLRPLLHQMEARLWRRRETGAFDPARAG